MSSSSVKNKQPAPIQITAEQLLREAHERRDVIFKPLSTSTASAECEETRLFRRKQFEDKIKRFPHQPTNWIRYADWEESIDEPARSRSIYERALNADPRQIKLWLAYTAFEIRAKNVNCARNVFQRAVTLLPRCDLLWYKYCHLEEAVAGNVEAARALWNQWTEEWNPAAEVYLSFIKFERRHQGTWEGAIRSIWVRLLEVHCERADLWMRFQSEVPNALEEGTQERIAIFQTALAALKAHELQPALVAAYAKLLCSVGNVAQAEAVVEASMLQMHEQQEKCEQLAKEWYKCIKQYCTSTAESEKVLLQRRTRLYERRLVEEEHSPLSNRVDIWMDYARMMQDFSPDIALIRSIWQRATTLSPTESVPAEKRIWKRWIWLWIYWAHFEEFHAHSIDRALAVYSNAVCNIIPHTRFTFAKLWIHYAQCLARNGDLTGARKLFGQALGQCPKPKLFRAYAEFEADNCELGRLRTILLKWIETFPVASEAWISAACLEVDLGEWERARSIWELALQQPELDDAEAVWKCYIEIECSGGEWQRARALYERLVQLTEHVKVWLSFASFEALGEQVEGEEEAKRESGQEYSQGKVQKGIQEDAQGKVQKDTQQMQKNNTYPPDTTCRTRKVLQRALEIFKAPSEERLLVLTAWKEFEESRNATQEQLQAVQRLMPIPTNGKLQWPTEQKTAESSSTSKLLGLAHKWKQQTTETPINHTESAQ